MTLYRPGPACFSVSPGLNSPPSLPAWWECDLADDSLCWSSGVYDIFGIPHGAALNRCDIVDMYVGESRAQLDRLRAAALLQHGSFTFEAQIRRLDGALRWMRVTADVLCRDGRPVRLYGVKQDITDDMIGAGGGARRR